MWVPKCATGFHETLACKRSAKSANGWTDVSDTRNFRFSAVSPVFLHAAVRTSEMQASTGEYGILRGLGVMCHTSPGKLLGGPPRNPRSQRENVRYCLSGGWCYQRC